MPFKELLPEEWNWIMQFITTGGDSLTAYNEFSKVSKDVDGLWKVKSRQIAMRHRLHIGTIVSDAMLKVKYLSGWLYRHDRGVLHLQNETGKQLYPGRQGIGIYNGKRNDGPGAQKQT